MPRPPGTAASSSCNCLTPILHSLARMDFLCSAPGASWTQTYRTMNRLFSLSVAFFWTTLCFCCHALSIASSAYTLTLVPLYTHHIKIQGSRTFLSRTSPHSCPILFNPVKQKYHLYTYTMSTASRRTYAYP
ncbi:hypothetical protein DENSPDRAFT_834659 [Dentipellis sp. KUC8613]|nr:hypothetical protein DENSPDRAFT_834659 [Dentipellis sp. KUC8613]